MLSSRKTISVEPVFNVLLQRLSLNQRMSVCLVAMSTVTSRSVNVPSGVLLDH